MDLDKLFCGLFSRCADILREDEPEESSEQNYLIFSQKQFYTVPITEVIRGNIQEPPTTLLKSDVRYSRSTRSS